MIAEMMNDDDDDEEDERAFWTAEIGFSFFKRKKSQVVVGVVVVQTHPVNSDGGNLQTGNLTAPLCRSEKPLWFAPIFHPINIRHVDLALYTCSHPRSRKT